MANALEALYKQIKERKISEEEALEKLVGLKADLLDSFPDSGKKGRQEAAQEFAQQLAEKLTEAAGGEKRCWSNLFTLADLYCQGYTLPWQELYSQIKPRRISLPTYPFVRERYLVPQVSSSTDQIATTALHPLLQANTSDFKKQRFGSANCDPVGLASDSGESLRMRIQSCVLDLLSRALNLHRDKIEEDKEFLELGIDSIVSVRLAKELRTVFKVELSGRDIFECRTVNTLTSRLTERLQEHFSADRFKGNVVENLVPVNVQTQEAIGGRDAEVASPEGVLEELRRGEMNLIEAYEFFEKYEFGES